MSSGVHIRPNFFCFNVMHSWYQQEHGINADFKFGGDFMCFMSNLSKIGFLAFQIKTHVHRAHNNQLCGRHQISHIFMYRRIG